MSIYFDILSCVLSAVTLLIVSQHVPIADVHEPHETPPISSDSEELTSYEKERLLREESFDLRIAQIKDELSKRQKQHTSSNQAQPLHPDVHNLPHNTITDTQQAPDIEYAD